MSEQSKPGILILEDGTEFEGRLFGAPVSAASIAQAAVRPKGGTSNDVRAHLRDRGYGEVVFNTSMTGYQEILTDPSYYGEIVCMTAAHIGNTGVNADDPESPHPWCAGFVVQEHSMCPPTGAPRAA